jgi:F-box-like
MSFQILPQETIVYCFSFLDQGSLHAVSKVSRDLKQVSEDDSLWGKLAKAFILKEDRNHKLEEKRNYKRQLVTFLIARIKRLSSTFAIKIESKMDVFEADALLKTHLDRALNLKLTNSELWQDKSLINTLKEIEALVHAGASLEGSIKLTLKNRNGQVVKKNDNTFDIILLLKKLGASADAEDKEEINIHNVNRIAWSYNH